MVWVPTERVAFTLAPEPSPPSRLDDQLIAPERLPSSASLAEPEKLIGVPSLTLVPFEGESIETVGAVLVGPPVLPRSTRKFSSVQRMRFAWLGVNSVMQMSSL